MDVNALYDLLRHLSSAGREVAAQQGLTGSSGFAHPVFQEEDVALVRAFAEHTSALAEVWQGMPQAGISLSDVSRCCRVLFL